MSESKPFEAVVDQILAGKAPTQIRAAAARGALPLPRATLVRLAIALTEDDDEQIRADAQSNLNGLGSEAINEVLGDVDCAPEVLKHFAPQAAKDQALAERIAFHRSVPAAALAKLAAAGTASVIELVLTNQERLLEHPELLNLLSVNPALQAEQRGRILELLDRMGRAAAAAPETTEQAGEDGGVAASDEFQAAARLLEIDVGELFAASEITNGEEFEQSDDVELRNTYQRIITLNAAQKAVLAMRGGREERMILIRDTNRMVALGVLRNPRIQEHDIEKIAKMRSVSDDVLRAVGQNREWSKNYSVCFSLVTNPRTPQGITTNFVPRLHTQDLKRIGKNKDIPELIRRMAKRTLDLRTQRKR